MFIGTCILYMNILVWIVYIPMYVSNRCYVIVYTYEIVVYSSTNGMYSSNSYNSWDWEFSA